MSSFSPRLSQRVISLEGTSNFRDIGGYQTKGGMGVRWGQLYRSASLDTLSLTDQKKLQELGVADSIDLRSGFERKKFAYAYPFLKTHACSIDSQITEVAFAALKNHQPLTVNQASEFMLSMYKDFVLTQQDHFARFFDLVIAQKHSTVFHCTAGKDRTGYACALLHSAEQSFNGVLLGVLPASKVFEFKISPTDKIIKGKISPELKGIDSIYQEWLFNESKIDCKLVTVGQGTPRYTLTSISKP